MALLNVTRNTVTGRARQFDGSLDSFLDIIGARTTASLVATCGFDGTGAFVRLNVQWPAGSVALAVSDWIVFPDDVTQAPTRLSNTEATTAWHAS